MKETARQIPLEQLAAFLSARSDIVFAVVFGSAESGRVEPGSDFDLGVYFEPKPDTEALAAFLQEVSDSIGFDRVDFTDMTKADPVLAFEAISGRFLCKNDRATTAAYCSRVCREYEDLMAELHLPLH